MVLSVEPGDFIPWDNPDNLVSQEVEQAVDLAVAVFFLPALLLLSVPTNVVNMLVFCVCTALYSDFQNEDVGAHHLFFHSGTSWIHLHRSQWLGHCLCL